MPISDEEKKLASESFNSPGVKYRIGERRFNGQWQELEFVGYHDNGNMKWLVEGSDEAKAALKEFAPFPYKGKKPVRMWVNIDLIQPYDFCHKRGEIEKDEYHNQGIEMVKKLIKDGKPIRPMLVSPDAHKIDGFKRYMAFKQLGYKKIECIIHPNPPENKQKGLPWVTD